MCWNEAASYSMVGIGAAATFVAHRRGEPTAIWLTMGYFTAMEALQAGGYAVIDQCGSPGNRAVTLLSYLHIAFQPIFINAFIMAIAPEPLARGTRRIVLALAGLASAVMLLRLVPLGWVGACQPGDVLCGPALCTRSGDWHLAWDVPFNDLWSWVPGLGDWLQFPSYMLAVFLLPLLYGGWRFVAFHAICGPLLASTLTTDPNEMPAVWCLFSIGILLVGLSPAIRRHVAPAAQMA